jgi:hypothetical protein
VFPIDDETLPNFIKRKHPRKGEKKKKQGAGNQTAQKRWPKRKQGTNKY